MNIEIWSLGKQNEDFIEKGLQYYFQKTKPWNPVSLVVLQLPKKNTGTDIARTKQQEEELILKKLEEGYTVISDRFYFSSYAYQGTHVNLDWVINANSLSANLRRPDLNIYIDITAEQSIERINKGRSSVELYETLDNLEQVRNKYFEVMDLLKDDEEIFVTDGGRAPEIISNEIWKKIAQQF